MAELDARIGALRELLHAERAAPPVPESAPIEIFEGHEPAHAAPGPLLDKLHYLDGSTKAGAHEHRPMHAEAN